MNHLKDQEDVEFAYKVRRAMHESSEQLSPETLSRLAKSRELALSQKKEDSPLKSLAFNAMLAGNLGGSVSQRKTRLTKLSLLLPLAALLVGLYGIYTHIEEQQIQDLAEIDSKVLTEEVPPDAYLDEGFNAYLQKTEE
jgi:hypothetical protein